MELSGVFVTSIPFKVIEIFIKGYAINVTMPKSNFLLVDLNEPKTKKLAETITSETSRKILNYLAEKDDTEQNVAQALQIPISTVHYHLQKLQEAGLVIVEEFHYSQKGREVNHYKLANKYIIIAPRKVIGLKEKLKGILPVALIVLGISGIIKLVQNYAQKTSLAPEMMKAAAPLAQESADAGVIMMGQAVPIATTYQPDIALWFLLGSIAAILIYIIVEIVREKIRK